MHHHDLTYSLAVPQSRSSVGAAPAIYGAVHEVFVTWLMELGLAARQWRETYKLPTASVQVATADKSEFLCFHRRSEGDVVVGDHKLVGSAQRRIQGALLQHGSLLIAKSCHAPSLLGLSELLPHEGEVMAKCRLFAEELLVRIQRGIDALLDIRVQCGVDSLSKQLDLLAAVKIARFAAPEWRCRV